jgi:uncharacterized protein YndB with AHSA1/START domain
VFRFDPDRVAALEAAGWRAYYERRWGTLLRLVVELCQEQFHIPFPVSILAAYYATRASIAWAPVDHDLRAVQGWYARFYRLVRRYSGLRFDPARAAALELEYNIVHRELVGKPDKAPFVETLTLLHSEIFGLSLEQARESAEQRVLANNIVDRITSGASTDAAADWVLICAALRRCYESILRQLPRSADEPTDSDRKRAYAFTTIWEVAAPIDAVWDAIYHSERWPTWWPYVAAVTELEPGDAQGLGAVRRFAWSTRLPYRFEFDSRITRVDRPYVLEATADGQLVGMGRWTLTPNGAATVVRYDWNVRTRVAWMNAVAPVARPVFAWNHAAVMQSGAVGLGRLLGTQVRTLQAQ